MTAKSAVRGVTGRTSATVRQDFADREMFGTPSGWKLGMLSFEKVSGERMIRISINKWAKSLPIKLPHKSVRPVLLWDSPLERGMGGFTDNIIIIPETAV